MLVIRTFGLPSNPDLIKDLVILHVLVCWMVPMGSSDSSEGQGVAKTTTRAGLREESL
jgi:hypothetical protein